MTRAARGSDGRVPSLRLTDDQGRSWGQWDWQPLAGQRPFDAWEVGESHVEAYGALVEAGTPPDRLFVPFTDLTSGTETYSAGRYLELDRAPSGIYTIDFNRAFHPYCYYNESYDCPYPPPSNRLPTPVRAGEKLAQSNIPAAGR